MTRPDLTPTALAMLDSRRDRLTWPPGPVRDQHERIAARCSARLSQAARDAGEDLVVPLEGGVSIRVPCEGRAT
jgi:hypothetical protein